IVSLSRAAELSKIAVAVDCAEHVSLLAAACRRYGVSIFVLIEVDVGSRRGGVSISDGESVSRLVSAIEAADGLFFHGIQAFAANIEHIADEDTRRRQVGKTSCQLRQL